jgi:hypothetical protein
MEPENNTIMNSMVRLQGIQTCGLLLLLCCAETLAETFLVHRGENSFQQIPKVWRISRHCVHCTKTLRSAIVLSVSEALERFHVMEYKNIISVPLDEAQAGGRMAENSCSGSSLAIIVNILVRVCLRSVRFRAQKN